MPYALIFDLQSLSIDQLSLLQYSSTNQSIDNYLIRPDLAGIVEEGERDGRRLDGAENEEVRDEPIDKMGEDGNGVPYPPWHTASIPLKNIPVESYCGSAH